MSQARQIPAPRPAALGGGAPGEGLMMQIPLAGIQSGVTNLKGARSNSIGFKQGQSLAKPKQKSANPGSKRGSMLRKKRDGSEKASGPGSQDFKLPPVPQTQNQQAALNQDIQGAPPSGQKQQTLLNKIDAAQRKVPDASVNALSLGGIGNPGQTMQSKNAQLVDEYAKRFERMQRRIDAQIKTNVLVPDAVKVEKRKPLVTFEAPESREIKDLEASLQAQIDEKNKGITKDLDLVPTKDPNANKETYSYHRSKRAVEFRIKEGFDANVTQAQDEKTALVQRLNNHLLQLDKLNEEKRLLSGKLVEQIQFVRTLQSQIGTADNGNITDVIDRSIEDQFRKEKHLNIQLKEKLKECEVEKCRIVEQLKFLEGQKDVTVVTKTDNHVELEKQIMNTDGMLKYRQQILRDTDGVIRDLELLRNDEERTLREIEAVQRDVHAMALDKAHYDDKVQMLQLRIDDGQQLVYRDNNDLKYELKRQKSLLGTKVIFNSVSKAIGRQTQANFDHLITQLKFDDQKIGGILAFRKVCLNYNRRRLGKYFNKWYQRGLKPLCLLRQNDQITQFQLKHQFQKQMLLRWSQQLIRSQRVASGQTQQIGNLIERWQTFGKRQLKYAFTQWRRNCNNIKLAQTTLVNFIKDKLLTRQRQAFLKWNRAVQFEDHMIRVSSTCTRGALNQYKTTLFYAWINVAKSLKRRRIALLVRTWNCLNKNRQYSQINRYTTQLVLRMEVCRQEFLIRNCFNAIKLNKEQEKHMLVNQELKESTDVAIEQTSKDVQRIKAQSSRTQRTRGVEAVGRGLGKLIKQYFVKWRDFTKSNPAYMEKLKTHVYNMYRGFLANAFNKWRKVHARRRKKKRAMQMEAMQGEAKAVEAEIQATKEKNKAEAVRSKNKGDKTAKKVMWNLYRRVMKYRLDQWRSTLGQKDVVGDKLERTVIVKMQRRILKLAFKQFHEKSKLVMQEQNGDAKGAQYAQFVTYNSKKRMFKAMKKFYQDFHRAKAFFKTVYRKSETRAVKSWFYVWKRGFYASRDESNRGHQNAIVDEVQQSSAEAGSLNEQNLAHETKVENLTKQMNSLGQKTMAKIVARWARYRQYTALTMWRERAAHGKRFKQRIQQTVIQRWRARAVHQAFQTWRAQESRVKRRKHRVMMEQVQQEQKNQEENTANVQKTRKRNQEVQSARLSSIGTDQAYNKGKIKNVIDKICYDTANYYQINRKKHIFQTWRARLNAKLRATCRLAHLMRKSQHQVGFDGIREADWQYRCHQRKIRRIRQMIKIFYRRRFSFFFGRWKECLSEAVTGRTKHICECVNHKNQNGAFRRNDRQGGVIKSALGVSDVQIMRKVFKKLSENQKRRAYEKTRHQKMCKAVDAMRARHAVQKWRQRAFTTKVARQSKQNLLKGVGTMRLRQCYKALKREWLLKGTIFKVLATGARNVDRQHLKFALEQIKQQARLRWTKECRDRDNSYSIIHSVFARFDKRRVQRCFNKMRHHHMGKSQKKSRLKSIIGRQLVLQYRHCFDRWKKSAQKRSVAEFAHDYGEVRQELNNLNRDARNLKELLDDEGYTPKEVAEMLAEDSAAYKRSVQRTMLRLHAYGEGEHRGGDKWLLAWCLDTWRRQNRTRKLWAYWLDAIANLANKDKVDVQTGFERWKTLIPGRKQQLRATLYKDLDKIDQKNRRELLATSDLMNEKVNIISEAKTQRNFLITKVVAAQRLGLDRCHMSYQNAKEKAWRKFVVNCREGMRAELTGAARANVAGMAKQKDHCAELEEVNKALAEENDQIKEGMKKSIKLVEMAEGIHKELEQLSMQLADKAVTIRKLLNDNTVLNRRLLEAEQKKKMQQQ